MRRQFPTAIAFLLLLVGVSSGLSTTAVASTPMELTDWFLFSTADPSTWYPVTVPNTVLGALFSSGAPGYQFEPFYGKNLNMINHSDFTVPWTFTRNVSIPTLNSGARVVLELDGLIYNATLDVNGVRYSDDELFGAFRRFKLDITSLVTSGASNTLSITVQRPYEKPKEVRDGTGLSISFYDWAPHPADLSMGLWRPVYLSILQETPVTMNGLSVKAMVERNVLGNDTFSTFLNISVAVKNWGTTDLDNVEVFFDSSITGKITKSVSIPAGAEQRVAISWVTHPQLALNLPANDLWWPWQMGEPTLHTMTGGVGSKVIFTRRIGIRQVDSKLTDGGALQMYVNRQPILIRAGAWCPDLFLRTNDERLAQEFKMVRAMNLNGIRLEGKAEHERFFELADESGILLLADVGCCEKFPNWTSTEFAVAKHAMREQVRKLEPHPSVAWILASSDFMGPVEVEKAFYQIYREEAWPNVVVSSASENYSPLSGTSGVKLTGPYSWVPPSYWLADSSPQLYNKGGAWGFFTEGGPGEAPMTYNSWLQSVPSEHLWGVNGSLGDYWNYFMGNPNGAFPSLQYFTPPLNARYGSSTGAQDYLYRAQVANYESIRAMYEGYTRNKHKNATGVVQWMMNNARPEHLWHLYDYYLGAGGGFYGARKANEPLHASLSFVDGTVALINSMYTDVRHSISVSSKIIGLSGNVLFSASVVVEVLPANGVVELPQLTVPLNGGGSFGPSDTFFVVLEWTVQGQTSDNWYWLSPTMDVIDWNSPTPTAGFRTPCSQFANFTQLQTIGAAAIANFQATLSGGNQIDVSFTNNGPAPAFFVNVRVVNKTTGFDINPQFWSENYVSVLPGANRTLHCELAVASINPNDVDIVYESFNSIVAGRS